MCVHPKSYTKLAMQAGLLFAGLSVLCFIWPAIRGLDAELTALHTKMWTIAFFGYTGFNLTSLIAALIQSFIWGVIAVGVWRLMGFCVVEKGAEGEKHEHAEGGGTCCK